MPSGAAIIGKVAVKVIPDTKLFKRDAENALKKIETQLRDVKVKLVPQLDSAKVTEQAKALRRQVQTEMKDINLSVNLSDQASVRAAIARLRAELSRIGEVQIPVGVNGADIKAGIALLTDQLNKIASIDLKVNENSMASVQGALRRVEAELAKLHEIEIKVKLNESDLTAAQAMLHEKLTKLQDQAKIQADIKVNEDMAQSRRVLDQITAKLNHIQWAPGVDAEKLARTKAAVEAVLLQVADKKANLSLELDPLARRKIQLEIDALQARVHDMVVGLKPEVDQASKTKVQFALALLARTRTAVIKPVLHSSATQRVGKAIEQLSGFLVIREKLSIIGKILNNFDKYAPKVAAVGLGIVGIGGAAISASANLFALSASLASIAGAGLALPGIMGGLGIGIIASAVALKDFNKEFSNFSVGLGKLKAGDAWKQLQDVMSAKFWEQARKPIGDMVENLFPKFSDGLTKISSSLGTWFGSLATGLKVALGPRLGGMFDNLDASIKIATGSTGALAQSVGVLGSVGASYLPRLAQWFTNLANKTADWLTKAEQSGKLQQIIEAGITALKGLWSILSGVVQILGGIAKAAEQAGGSTLNTLGAALHHVADIVNSPAFQQGLKQVFGAALLAMKEIATIAGPAVQQAMMNIGHVLQAVLPLAGAAIGTLVHDIALALSNPALGQGLTMLFAQIVQAVHALTPIWFPLATAIGVIAPVLGQLLVIMAQLVAALATTLVPILQALMPPISDIIKILGQALIKVLAALEPVIVAVADAFANVLTTGVIPALTTVVQALVPVLEQLAPLIGNVIVMALNAIAPLLPQVAKAFTEVLQSVVPLLPPLIQDLAPILPVLVKTFADLVIAVAPLIPSIADLLKALLPILPPLLQLAQQALPLVTDAVKLLTGIIKGLIDALTWVILKVQEFLAMLWRKWNEALDWCTQKGEEFRAWLHGLPDRIVSGLTGLGNLLLDAGRQILEGFINGLKSRWKSVKDFFGNLTDSITSWKGPEKRDKVLLTNAGQLIMDGFLKGLESRYDAVRKSLTGLTSDISGMDMGTLVAPGVQLGAATGALATGAYAGSPGQSPTRVLNYYAAPGSSISSEEDLFTAAGRARMGGF